MAEMVSAAPYGEILAQIQTEAFDELASAVAPVLVAHLRASGLPVEHVVDIGCGAGTTTAALLDAGFSVTAIEPSAALRSIAQRRAQGARFIAASVHDQVLPPCQALLAVGEPLTYHPPGVDGAARLRTFFTAARRALPQAGQLIFDLVLTGTPSLDGVGYRAGSHWSIGYRTREDAAVGRLARHVDSFLEEPDGRYRRARETHHVQLFSRSDVAQWLGEAGFTVRTAPAYGAHGLAPRRCAFFATAAAD